MPRSAVTCVLCSAALGAFHEARSPRVCRGVSCRWTLQTTPRDRLCRICGTPLLGQQLAERLCTSYDCRDAWLGEQRHVHAEYRRKEREEFEARAGALRTASASAMHIANADDYLLISIPYTNRRMTRLPRYRRDAFRDRLRSVIDDACAQQAASVDTGSAESSHLATESSRSAMSDVLSQGCARCRGNCCCGGGTHAYLRPERMVRYMNAHPSQTPEDVLRAYMDHIGERTIQDSCVFHGSQGCTLPREMRADICNSFFCEGLRDLQYRAPQDGPVRAFYATEMGDEMRAAFVDVREVRVVKKRRDRARQPEAS